MGLKIIETIVILKLLGLGASLGCAAIGYRSMPEQSTRRKLMLVFRLGEIGIKKKNKNRETFQYPIITNITNNDILKAPFIIPCGLDPSLVTEKEWLFKQVFGENVNVAQISNCSFLLTIQKPIEKFDYDFEKINAQTEGLSLPIYAGKSQDGDVIYDMVDYPNLLITGEPGSGKSTILRSILTFFIQHFKQDQTQLYLADLKMTEFHLFRKLPHVAENVFEPSHVNQMLTKLLNELGIRKRLMNENEVAHINELPDKIRPPYIVICIDEFAMLHDMGDAMEIITLIAQQGRALGMYLILSCQRADRQVMDGKIKLCLTVRMAFRAADDVNSRITLDSGEAALIKQSEKGKMYLKLESIQSVQAPYLELNKAKKILEPYKVNSKVEEIQQQEMKLEELDE